MIKQEQKSRKNAIRFYDKKFEKDHIIKTMQQLYPKEQMKIVSFVVESAFDMTTSFLELLMQQAVQVGL